MSDEQLGQILELAKENNKILRSMQRSARISRWIKIFYWVLLLGSIAGTYYYFQPYIDQIIKLYEKVSTIDPRNLKLPAGL